jgi:amino acid transporter
MEPEKKPEYDVGVDADSNGGYVENVDGLHRRLSNRQIQWIAIGGSIGTALFVSIAWGLVEGGPGSLFIAFFLYSCMLALVNSTMAEMAVFMPVSGGFVRQAAHWVDEVWLSMFSFGSMYFDKFAGIWLYGWMVYRPVVTPIRTRI